MQLLPAQRWYHAGESSRDGRQPMLLAHRRRLFFSLSIAFAMALVLGSSLSLSADDDSSASSRPNVVIILADDMGYGDAHPLNPETSLPTPALDRLASQGMIFTDAHSPAAVCTPTRYGLMTGRYCWRTELTYGVLQGRSQPLIDVERTTISSLFHDQGYQTGVVGKWHLGLGFTERTDGPPPRDQHDASVIDYTQPIGIGPRSYGFDYSMIIPASLDMPPYIYIRDHQVVEVPTIEDPGASSSHRAGLRAAGLELDQVMDDLLDDATAFIQRSAEEDAPFFLYFPLSAPHKPVVPHERFRGESGFGAYGDFIMQIDAAVAQIMETLEATGEAENTLLIFTSDNGSVKRAIRSNRRNSQANDQPNDIHHANGLLRGGKTDLWEGGHRVPYLVSWPGHIAPGSRCDTTICQSDLLSTFADLLEVELPEGAGPDSYTTLPLLLGEPLAEPRPPIIHQSVFGMLAIRSGRWKLILCNGSGGKSSPRGTAYAEPYALYDLEEDLGERNNLINEHPEIAERLLEEFDTITGGVHPATRPPDE